MVKKFIANLIINNAMQIGKSVLKAYSKTVGGAAAKGGGSSGGGGGGAAADGFNKMKE